MPTSVGPNIFGEENLVFGYDLGDVVNSYKGEPATNLITSGLPGYFGSGGETLYQDRLYGLKSDSGVFQRNYVTNPALADSATYNNNAGLYKTFSTATLNPATEFIQISFDFYMIVPYVRINSSGTGLNGYLGVSSTDSTVDNYGWNTTYSNGSGDDWNNNSAYVGKWQKVSLIVDLRDDKVPQSITAMYIYNDRTLQGEGIFTNFIITEHITFPTGPVRYTAGTRSATQGLIDLTGNSTIDLTNVSFDSNAQMTFDGTNDYITLSSTSHPTGSCSMEIVFNHTHNFVGSRYLLYGASGTAFWVFFRGDWAGNLLYFTRRVTNSGNYGDSAWGYTTGIYQPVPANETMHLIFTHDATSGEFKCYKNGILTRTVNGNLAAYGALNTTQQSHYIGGSPGDNLPMTLPLFKFYDRVLSSSEVALNFKAIKGRFNI
jgi:hypothetical protein